MQGPECARVCLPVAGSNVASVVGRHATTVDYYSENHEAGTCDDLEQAESKFNLAIALDAEELDDSQGEEKRHNPGRIVDVLAS